MPTYEYRCSNHHSFEQFQRINDPPLRTCPQCGAGAERVLSGGGGLLFKGSGFYITDYRSDKYRKAAESDRSAPAPAADKSAASEKAAPGSAPGGSQAS